MKSILSIFSSKSKIRNEKKGDRVFAAINAKKNLVNDFFGGWDASDISILERYKYNGETDASPGEMVDWLGIKTDLNLHAWLPKPRDKPLLIKEIPIPDDRVHAETIEYLALIFSIERSIEANNKKRSFTAIELGASYAPWVVASGVMALRNGFDTVNLVAVEANKTSVPKIVDHAKRNGLLNSKKVNLQAIHGAASINSDNVYFPKVDTNIDNGAQITREVKDTDYRGVRVDYDVVKGVPLSVLCSEYSRVDLLHMDLQGAEEALLLDASFLEALNSKVATLFIATQSRFIEGIALQALSKMGWTLHRERPTTYAQNNRTNDINGWTLRDGGQIWFNRNLSEK